jgi:membrane-bound serine protease (ClpP class)
VGEIGEVREPLDPEGQIFIEGALWRARIASHGSRIDVGNRVRVKSVDGLTLEVEPAADRDPASAQKGT